MSKLMKQIDGGEDRISCLPDTILVTILSLLPLHNAAATSVLAQRWRYLWTHLTHVSLLPLFKKYAFFKEESFDATVDHILTQLKSPKIHSFRIQLLNKPETRSNVGRWIHQICQRNPKIVQVSPFSEYGFGDKFCLLPVCILRTQSLVQLQLNEFFMFTKNHDDYDELYDNNNNSSSSINLPNLKKLSLNLHDWHCSLLNSLLKSCTLLEELELTLNKLGGDRHPCVDISAPNLKLLRIQIGRRDIRLRRPYKFVIDAPMLEQCHISGVLMDFDFIHKPTSLRQASLEILDSEFDSANDFSNKIMRLSRLFQGISCVEHLILKRCDVDVFSEVTVSSFPNLIYLDISQSLVEEVPAFFLNNLERLALHDLTGYGYEDEMFAMIEDILRKATRMKELHVDGILPESDEEYDEDYDEDRGILQKEYNFCVQLFTHFEKRSLSCCDIKFIGYAILASKKDFKDGVLWCQIKKFD